MSRGGKLNKIQKTYILERFEEAVLLKDELSVMKEAIPKDSPMRENFNAYAAAVKEYRKAAKKLLVSDTVTQKDSDRMSDLADTVTHLKGQIDVWAEKRLAAQQGQSLTVH